MLPHHHHHPPNSSSAPPSSSAAANPAASLQAAIMNHHHLHPPPPHHSYHHHHSNPGQGQPQGQPQPGQPGQQGPNPALHLLPNPGAAMPIIATGNPGNLGAGGSTNVLSYVPGSGVASRMVGKRKRLGVWDKYDLVGQIGQGTYGIVFKAKSRNPDDPREYAIKKFKTTPDADGLSQSACREIMLCRELKHENVISLQEVILDPLDKSIAMVIHYAEHDLLQILDFHREKQSQLSDTMVKSILWQIINGVHYLHSNWVLHRDLKPANILIMGDGLEKGYVKVADLGLARLFQSPLLPLHQADRVVVTIWYRSPELLLGAKHYTKAIDVWSIGCIFAELIMGYGLFKGKEVKADRTNRNPFQRDQLEKIFYHLGIPTEANWNGLRHMPDADKLPSFSRHHPEKPLRMVIGKKISPNGFKLLERMLEFDPTKRISAEEALDHPYFTDDPKPSMNIFEGSNNFVYPKRNVVQDEEVKKELEAMQAARKKKRLN